MLEFFRSLFGTDFMPHLYCLRNDPAVLWLQVVSDLGIALAYFAIPLLLFDVVRKRRDPYFRKVALLFVLFIAACGVTHVLAVWTIWIPVYRLEAVTKAATAIISILTAVALFRLRPTLMKLPSIAELQAEIEARLRAEQRALAAKGQLAEMVDRLQDYAVYSIDPKGLVRSWDIGAEQLKGYKPEEIIGRNFSCLYGAEDIARGKPEEAIRIATEKGRFEADGWRSRKDGSRFWANVILRPQRDETGKLLGFTKITHDLTESRETESKFQALLEAAPDAILIVTREGIITFANVQAERVYGYSRGELLGKHTEMLSPTELRTSQGMRREELFRHFERAEVNADAGLINMRKDGTSFPIEFTLSPLETREGWVFLLAIRDVSERLKAEDRFRGLLESAPDAMVIIDSQGKMELVNLQTERMFGYTRAELIGSPVDMLMHVDFRALHSGHRSRFFESPRHREMGAGLDLLALRKDGSEFPVEISLSPLDGRDGLSVTAAIRDVTERKKSETRFRALLDSAPDAMVIVRSDGVIELANIRTEEIFGYSRLELVGKSVDLLVPAIREALVAVDSPMFTSPPKQRHIFANLDLPAFRRDGTEFPVEISLSPLESPLGVSVTAAIRDVSERKLAARLLAEKVTELNHTNEALEQFAHIASHDLQEPLRMVSSYLQLIAKRYVGRLDKDADEFIAYAVDGSRRMKLLIGDLLAYSRAGQSTPGKQEVSSEEALAIALGDLRASIQDSQAIVTHDPLPVVFTIGTQLVQLFQNLIGNAIKYRGDRVPHVHLSSSETGPETVFSVKDNGIGIETRYYERIFQIFQRLHVREEYEGTGIGLAICQRILTLQGGRIWVDSEPGKGSTFYFSLPAR